MVVASYTGRTALKMAKVFKGMDITLIAVVGWGERMRLSEKDQNNLKDLELRFIVVLILFMELAVLL
ncbi:MAG: hypothetical protein QG670_2589 [Thermoproteota archaeon]|nr:hypothetical protein [Thermoproteota archaeon]